MKAKKFFVCIALIFLLFNILVSNFSNVHAIDINSPYAIVVDTKTGKIIYEKNAYEKRYPASTTKVMTAILILENCNLNDKVICGYDAIVSVPVGYTTASLQVGEEVSVKDLLYMLLIISANDAANVLAEYAAGSIENFAKMMNDKATELGCQNTNFVNPSGIHDKNHYSTAYDLSLIARYAMKNEKFREIVKTTTFTVEPTNKYNARAYTTINELLIMNNAEKPDNYYYEYATGIKTGYTDVAKNCLIASAYKDNIELIIVILGALQTPEGVSQRYVDTKALFNYAFDAYTTKKIREKGSSYQKIVIPNASRSTRNLNLVLENDITVLVKKENANRTLLPEVSINQNLQAPIEAGTVVGTISYTAEDITYTTNLLAANDVKEETQLNIFLKLLLLIIVLLIFIKINGINKKKNRKRKRVRRR